MSSRPETDYIHSGRELVEAPHDAFERIRKDGDIVWSRKLNCWLVVSRNLAMDILKSPDFCSFDLSEKFAKLGPRLGEDFSDILFMYRWLAVIHDDDHHTRLRSALAQALAAVRDEYVCVLQQVSHTRLTEMANRKICDFATDYADRLHVDTLGQVLRFPAPVCDKICEHAVTKGSIDIAPSVQEMRSARDFSRQLLHIITDFVATHAQAEWLVRMRTCLQRNGLPDEDRDLAGFLAILFMLGRDTISGALVTGIDELLRQNNGEISGAVWQASHWQRDEILRLATPTQVLKRVAKAPVLIGGQKIDAGEEVTIFLAAANRDPETFVCPHSASFENEAHMVFGAGRHLCVGKPVTIAVFDTIMPQLFRLGRIKSLPGRILETSKVIRSFRYFPVEISGYHP